MWLGAGQLAAWRRPSRIATSRSLITPVVFGIGLFVAAEAWLLLNGQ